LVLHRYKYNRPLRNSLAGGYGMRGNILYAIGSR
jgi:hypothetical protein